MKVTSSIFLPAGRDSYYVRLTVPTNLQPCFGGRKEVWRSLRTADKELAQVKASTWQASGRRLFLTLRRYGGRMTQDQIEALVQHWLDTTLDETDHNRLLAGPVTDEQYIDRDKDLTDYQDILLEWLRGNELERMTEPADQLLQSAGLPTLDHDSLAFKQLCRRLLEAQLEWTAIQRDRLDGLYPAFRPRQHRQSSLTVEITPQTATPEAPTKLFSEVVTLYYEENKPRSKRSGEQVQSELKRFTEVIGGDCQISLITKDQCRTYKEHLLKSRSLALVTVVKWLGIVSTIFRWAIRQGYMPDHFKNPMEGLAPNSKRAKAESKSHRDYTDQELLRVFGSDLFRKQRFTRPDRYWLCLICLFSGCRREEAGQLLLTDIQEQDGIPYFNFSDAGEDQGLKNADSRRKVPIHLSLIALGFLEYIGTLRQTGETRLFPTLKKGKSTFADATGKWYARLLNRVGLTDKTLVLHGLRHTFVTRLSDAGVPEKIKMMLAGHAAQGVHGKVYDHRERVPMRLLQEGLEKLRYDEVLLALTNDQREAAA